MPIFFVRHGESIGNKMSADERALSTMHNRKYPLTDKGKEQAQIMGEYLEEKFGEKQFNWVFESDFTRSRETLDIILNQLSKRPKMRQTDSRLNEKWDGIFHELTKAEIEERYPEQVRLKARSGNYFYSAPGGENYPDVELRVRSFLDQYYQRFCSRNVLIVGHGRWFLAFQKVFLDQSEQEMMKRYDEPVENCSLVTFSNNKIMSKAVVPWLGKLDQTKTEFA